LNKHQDIDLYIVLLIFMKAKYLSKVGIIWKKEQNQAISNHPKKVYP